MTQSSIGNSPIPASVKRSSRGTCEDTHYGGLSTGLIIDCASVGMINIPKENADLDYMSFPRLPSLLDETEGGFVGRSAPRGPILDPESRDKRCSRLRSD